MQFTSTNASPLTIEQIARIAPSAMAVSQHSSRSSRYTYIPTSDVIVGMQKAGFAPFSAKQSSTRDESRRDFTKHMIRFRQVTGQALKVGDTFAEIVLINSHDGTSAYQLMAGLWRLACGNGMTVSESLIASLSIHHKGNIVEQVIEGSFALAGQSEKTLSAVADWQGLQLMPAEQNILAEAAHTLRFADEEGKTHTPITPAQLLQPRRVDDNGADLWRTFNRVQENVVRGGVTARGLDSTGRRRRVTSREIKGIDQDVKLNRALWQIAEKMAELKKSA
jgi:uncharacterized protein DUF932